VIVDYKKGTRNETRKKLYETLTPHTARHGFGAMMLQNGIPMQTVSELLGHKSIKVTEKWYKHIDLTKDVHKANLLIDQAVRSFEKEREDTTPPQNLSSPGGA
jgi:integrase